MEILALPTTTKEMSDRFKRMVTHLIKSHDVDDVAKNLNCTTYDLMEGSPKLFTREVVDNAARIYRISLLWVWTGRGPKMIKK